MNFGIVFRLLGLILVALGGALIASAGIGYLVSASVAESRGIIGCLTGGVIALVAGLGAFWRARQSPVEDLYHKEALAVIGLGWLIASAIGAIPYLIVLPGASPADAFFESASGLTTTGASVFGSLEDMPRSVMFWRCLSQWIGGLGVVVFFVAVLSFLGAGGKILFSRESSGQAADIFDGKMRTGASRIMGLYLVVSAACAVTYHMLGMGWYDSLCHMFTTVSTGGFSTRSASLGAFASPALEWAAIVYMAFCGISFILVLKVAFRDRAALRTNSELGAYLLLTVVASAAIYILLIVGHGQHQDGFRAAVFQVVSIVTTTGFGTADFNTWPYATHVILLGLMFAGGCSGSTAGGVKVVRLVAAWRILRSHIERSFRPHVVRSIKGNGKALSADEQSEILVFLLLAVLICAFGTAWIGFLESDSDLVTAGSAVVASLFNIGPGLAAVGPTENYAHFTEATKAFLAVLMIAGRLEFYAILALFSPSLWRRFS